jgi:tRNA/rRNA methyltransferase
LHGTLLAVACTARRREHSHEVVDARQAAARLLREAAEHPVAVVFGNEASGLTGEEVGKCQLLTTIPANAAYSSLNLACAVQIVAYELHMAGDDAPLAANLADALPASHEALESFYRHFEETTIALGYLDPEQPGHLMTRIRRLFARARPEPEEIDLLHGVLRAVARRPRNS